MKKEKAFWGSIGILAGVLVAVMALTRGRFQIYLLAAILIGWELWIFSTFLLPAIRQPQEYRSPKSHKKRPTTPVPSGHEEDAMKFLLLRHVNYRISAYLKAAYPDITWEWCEKRPEELVCSGGAGRIRIFGVPDFTHADVTLDRRANISCELLCTAPLPDPNGNAGGTPSQPPNKQPIDPQIWYEMQGRQVLENLVSDLNSRGHSQITLHENGEICIEEGKKEIVSGQLSNFPEKVYWQRLINVLEGNGLSAVETAEGIVVSW